MQRKWWCIANSLLGHFRPLVILQIGIKRVITCYVSTFRLFICQLSYSPSLQKFSSAFLLVICAISSPLHLRRSCAYHRDRAPPPHQLTGRRLAPSQPVRWSPRPSVPPPPVRLRRRPPPCVVCYRSVSRASLGTWLDPAAELVRACRAACSLAAVRGPELGATWA